VSVPRIRSGKAMRFVESRSIKVVSEKRSFRCVADAPKRNKKKKKEA